MDLARVDGRPGATGLLAVDGRALQRALNRWRDVVTSASREGRGVWVRIQGLALDQ